MSRLEAGRVRLRFGEWSGATLGEVMRAAPDYLPWLLRESGVKLDFFLREAVETCVEGADTGSGDNPNQGELF